MYKLSKALSTRPRKQVVDLEAGLSALEARVSDLASTLGERLREAARRQEQNTTQAVANKATQSQSAHRSGHFDRIQ